MPRNMEKELVQIEFRYLDDPEAIGKVEHPTKTVTIGIYDTLEEAITEGNKALKRLAETFKFHPGDEFKKNHLWGMPKRLVCNICSQGIQIFAKITKLEFSSLDEAVSETFKARLRWMQYNQRHKD